MIVLQLENKYGKAADGYIERGERVITWAAYEQLRTVLNSKEQKQNDVTNAMIVVHCFDRYLSAKAAEEREEMNGESRIFEYF